MSIQSTTNRNSYVGTDLVSAYSYTFKIFNEDHIQVLVRKISDGTETVLTKTTDYTVSNVGASGGGIITLVNASQAWLTSGFLRSTYRIVFRLNPTLEQGTDIKNNNEYYAYLHERQFDKQFQISLRQQDELDRSLKLPKTYVGGTDFSMDLPVGIIGQPNVFIKTNTDGTSFNSVTQDELINTINTSASSFAPSRAIVSDVGGLATASATTATEVGYVSGVTSSIQTQLDSKKSRAYSTTATAAGTTTLTASSNQVQFFTGTTTQTVVLPVTSTLQLGYGFNIFNDSTGVVTVNSSGGNLVLAIPAGGRAEFICILTSGTTAASWSVDYSVGKSTVDTLTNKTIGNSNTVTVRDDRFTMQDNSDTTKQAVFDLSGITAGQTRTITVPDANSTIVNIESTQTITGAKTFSGTVVLPRTVICASAVGNPASATSGNPYIFPTVRVNQGNGYNNSTGRFTVPTGEGGQYFITMSWSGTPTGNMSIYWYKGGVQQDLIGATTATDIGGHVSVLVTLVAGDVVDIRGNNTMDISDGCITFQKLGGYG